MFVSAKAGILKCMVVPTSIEWFRFVSNNEKDCEKNVILHSWDVLLVSKLNKLKRR